jgi:hypothetical protein
MEKHAIAHRNRAPPPARPAGLRLQCPTIVQLARELGCEFVHESAYETAYETAREFTSEPSREIT